MTKADIIEAVYEKLRTQGSYSKRDAGEIVESSTTELIAEARELHGAPSFGPVHLHGSQGPDRRDPGLHNGTAEETRGDGADRLLARNFA